VPGTQSRDERTALEVIIAEDAEFTFQSGVGTSNALPPTATIAVMKMIVSTSVSASRAVGTLRVPVSVLLASLVEEQRGSLF
jgi:hypothetical protein